MSVVIDRWIDIRSEEFTRIKDYNDVRKLTLRGIELGAIKPDKNGNLYSAYGDPIHGELRKKLVGFRDCRKALS